MKKLIIHIGYPKTATTTLQYNLFTSLMREERIEYLNHLGVADKNLGSISIKNIMSYIIWGAESNESISAEIKELKKINKPITILSSESISHVSDKSPKAAYKTAALNNAKRCWEMFNSIFDTVDIVISIRAQKTIIPSYFAQEYFNIINDEPSFGEIGHWIRNNFNEDIPDDELIFNYVSMYKTYQKFFGENNVHLLIYEDLLYNKHYYYNQLAEIFKISPINIKRYLEGSIQNKTMKTNDGKIILGKKDLSVIIHNVTHKVLGNYINSDWFNFIKKRIKYIIPHQLLRIKTGSHVTISTLSNNESKLISKRFNNLNLQLIEVAGLDKIKMKEYEYFQ